MDKEEADVMEALVNWFESQRITPRMAVITMIGLAAVTIAKVARSEEDLLEGIEAAKKDMIELGLKAYRIGK